MPEEILPGANESPSAAEKFAGQSHDLNALRNAVVDAASVGAGIWLSYLFVLLYIAIAAGGITHKDLLLENAVKLPFLGVELPLVAFFFLAPILFIVSHGYTLVHFVMLAAKVGKFEEELRKQAPRRARDVGRIEAAAPEQYFRAISRRAKRHTQRWCRVPLEGDRLDHSRHRPGSLVASDPGAIFALSPLVGHMGAALCRCR
jgi:hypothetical protein